MSAAGNSGAANCPRRFPALTHPLNSRLLHAIRTHLKRGGVIAYATESCYGLGCDPRNYRAVQRLLALKERPQGKGLILIADDACRFSPFLTPLDAAQQTALARYWPGPFTFLLPTAPHSPRWLTGHHQRIALRVTAHPDAARLCHLLGMALVSTSANRSGRRPAKTFASCRKAFGNSVLVIPGKIGRRKGPSTIMDFISGKIVRK
jgi:L-threonylcarbamoyladenylate synthase